MAFMIFFFSSAVVIFIWCLEILGLICLLGKSQGYYSDLTNPFVCLPSLCYTIRVCIMKTVLTLVDIIQFENKGNKRRGLIADMILLFFFFSSLPSLYEFIYFLSVKT
ncbi:hypothetical protein BCR42DRAFT_422679 [Absidia repens]|uniref:Uncharacterized protein n=1 Tax=Absidia repens TaxID=90262 RepID=A0A1X2I772_9FUNG|nr:hypothetical protein BCR42DRAFT_430622 [Absidia repens]ORZ10571.1 hypothetical protein BCR42DRAFT_422679 [Absidia repens]